MGTTIKNVMHAVRALRRAPAFALATIGLVGLGVGSVTTVFTVVDQVLVRPLPYPAADRLVYMTNGSHNGPTLERLDDVRAFETWTATSTSSVNLTRDDGEPLRLRRTETTPSFFTLFGARPAVGRLLGEGDRNNTEIAVVSWQAWQEIWGGRDDLVGSVVRVDDEPVEVVGVLGRDFVQPAMVLGDPIHLFTPLDWNNPRLAEPGHHVHSVTARLGSGVPMSTADEQLDVVARDVAAAYADHYGAETPDWPLQTLHERTVQDYRQGLVFLLAAVGLLLLVACTNIAHLFMARGISRSREMAIRRAIGAGTRHVVAQLALESLVVGFAGGALGVWIGSMGLRLFARWTAELPRGAAIALDLRALALALALATTTAVVFGLLPTLRALGKDLQSNLRTGGAGLTGSRTVNALRSGMVIAEVALSLVLVTTAGLLMRSFGAVTSQDPGVEAEGVYLVPLNLAGVESALNYRTRMDAIRRSVEEIPGVRAATYGLEAPFEYVGGDSCCMGATWNPEDSDSAPLQLRMHVYAQDFLETFGTRLVAGRMWTPGEVDADPVPAIISEGLALRVFGSAESALGQEMTVRTPIRVVGVAEPTLHYGLDQPHDFAVYAPMELLGFPISRSTLAFRTGERAAEIGAAVREAIWASEGDLPVPEVNTMEAWIDRSYSARRLGRTLFGSFGGVALILAAAGLYGTLVYAVGQRRRELGIRLALGAGRGRVQGEVLRRGVVLATLGIGIGAVVSWFAGRLLEGFLFGVAPRDPVAFGASAALLLSAAILAAWIPAWRAGRTDPLETLKTE